MFLFLSLDLDLKSLLSEEDMPTGSPDAGKVGWEGSLQNVPLSHEKNYVFASPVKDTLNECVSKNNDDDDDD